MSNSNSAVQNKINVEPSNTRISPIEIESLRDQQKKEIQEQRKSMANHINGLVQKLEIKKKNTEYLKCFLASQTEERQCLENKLNEIQERQKKEKDIKKIRT